MTDTKRRSPEQAARWLAARYADLLHPDEKNAPGAWEHRVAEYSRALIDLIAHTNPSVPMRDGATASGDCALAGAIGNVAAAPGQTGPGKVDGQCYIFRLHGTTIECASKDLPQLAENWGVALTAAVRERDTIRERAEAAERIAKAYAFAVVECADVQDTHVAGPADVRTIAIRRDQSRADRDSLIVKLGRLETGRGDLESRITDLESSITSNRREIARMVGERDEIAKQLAEAKRVIEAVKGVRNAYARSQGHPYIVSDLDAALKGSK